MFCLHTLGAAAPVGCQEDAAVEAAKAAAWMRQHEFLGRKCSPTLGAFFVFSRNSKRSSEVKTTRCGHILQFFEDCWKHHLFGGSGRISFSRQIPKDGEITKT